MGTNEKDELLRISDYISRYELLREGFWTRISRYEFFREEFWTRMSVLEKKFGPGLVYSCMNKLHLHLVKSLQGSFKLCTTFWTILDIMTSKKIKTANAGGRHEVPALKSLHITSL